MIPWWLLLELQSWYLNFKSSRDTSFEDRARVAMPTGCRAHYILPLIFAIYCGFVLLDFIISYTFDSVQVYAPWE